jgi:hypothetical protein
VLVKAGGHSGKLLPREESPAEMAQKPAFFKVPALG